MTAGDAERSPADLVEHFFRHESGRLVASFVRRYGAARIELIEDAVQSALELALGVWSRRGVPDNPSAWLQRVAQNQVVDRLRHQAMSERAAPHVQAIEGGREVPPPHAVAFVGEIADDELRMLFVCCDDQLPVQAQLILSLKLLCGFSTREIAARLFLTDANVQKILTRGRDRLRELWTTAAPELPAPARDQLVVRLAAVQRVIYLLFNEGYSSQRDDEVIRRDLCHEALRLCQLLVSHGAGDRPESWALLALLHFHTARLSARTDDAGGLLSLDEQDRSRWDFDHIRRGFECLGRSGRGDRFSRYHAEAAVLAEHCMAPSFEQTRWSEIVELYELLERQEPSPLHTLNRAIALAEWQGPHAGLALLRSIAPPAWLAGYYLWDAAFGELHRRAGEFERAETHLERALERAPTEPERRFFRRRLERCRARDAGRGR